MLKRPYVTMYKKDIGEIYKARDDLRFLKKQMFDAAKRADFRSMRICRVQMVDIRRRIKKDYDIIL